MVLYMQKSDVRRDKVKAAVFGVQRISIESHDTRYGKRDSCNYDLCDGWAVVPVMKRPRLDCFNTCTGILQRAHKSGAKWDLV